MTTSHKTFDKRLGYASGIRLGFYYTLFYTIVSGCLFIIGYHFIAQTIHESALKLVRNQALEYRAWFLDGNIDQLEARMNEQSLQENDILFVHINGKDVDYVNFKTGKNSKLPIDELHNFNSLIEGSEIELGDRKWTIASVPVGRDDLVLQAGKNNQSADETLAKFRKIFLLLFIPGALISMLGGALLTYHTLAPIRKLIAVMRQILTSGDNTQRAEFAQKGNELNALVELFNSLLNRNERLIEGMKESLDHVAHDFRTPISRLKMTAEKALSNQDNSNELREALADSAEEAEYLEQLLTTVMNVTEAETGAISLTKEPIQLHSLLEDVVELYEFVAEENNTIFEINCNKELTVNADRTRLLQALANLLDNAIKYGRPDSKITISAHEDKEIVSIEVSDQGIGINEHDLKLIWNRLFRSDHSRTLPGMGLGLSLVKAITEAHGGKVHAESEYGTGTTIRLIFPYE